jgi:pyruvate dehydrogenase E1 component
VTASLGIELPGLCVAEPAYATALDWLLCDGLDRLTGDDPTSLYLRLSTRPVDQRPFEELRSRLGDEALRADVLAGGYRLVDRAATMPDAPLVQLVTCGAVVPEVLVASELLAAEGVAANVIELTSPSRVYHSWQGGLRAAVRGAAGHRGGGHLGRIVPLAERRAPIVTVHDAASHALAFVGSVFGARVVPVGVDAFGQSGSLAELHELFQLDPPSIVNAALVALS